MPNMMPNMYFTNWILLLWILIYRIVKKVDVLLSGNPITPLPYEIVHLMIKSLRYTPKLNLLVLWCDFWQLKGELKSGFPVRFSLCFTELTLLKWCNSHSWNRCRTTQPKNVKSRGLWWRSDFGSAGGPHDLSSLTLSYLA